MLRVVEVRCALLLFGAVAVCVMLLQVVNVVACVCCSFVLLGVWCCFLYWVVVCCCASLLFAVVLCRWLLSRLVVADWLSSVMLMGVLL